MANKEKTFAVRARELTKQYSRAEFDEIEKAELNEKLAELAQEQENYKQANGLNNEQNDGQPMPQFYDGGFGMNPIGAYVDMNATGRYGDTISAMNPIGYNPPQVNAGLAYDYRIDPVLGGLDYNKTRTPSTYSGESVANMNSTGSMSGFNFSGDGGSGMPAMGQYIPSIISGGISMLGNWQAAKRAEKHADNMLKMLDDIPPAKMNAYMQTPSLLNLEQERSNIRKDFDESKRSIARNIRNTSKGRGEYLSAIAGATTAIDRNRARAISESQLNESKYNAAARERASSSNIANRMRADQYNLGADRDYQNMRMAIEQGRFAQSQPYRDAMWQTIPQMTRDINQIYQQDQLIGSLGRDYGYVKDPNRKWWQMPQYQAQYRG